MSSSVLTIKLGHKILPGRVTIGAYDGKVSYFTAATNGERIVLLKISKPSNPDDPSSQNQTSTQSRVSEAQAEEISFLNINQPISCLAAGPMTLNSERCFLFVGTLTNVFGYDVENNKDLFFKEVIDGVNCMAIGQLGGIECENPIAISGGNCSLQGFDSEGNDVFWTVTGDNVGSLALFDFTGDGENEMIVGSDDYDIRIFKGDQLIGENTETDAIIFITHLHGSIYGYALANGTIGVYDKLTRLWRIKSKNQAVSICGFDFDGDGIPELVTGWSNGKLDIRNIRNGEVLFKDNFSHPLAGIIATDLYRDGKIHLLSCDTEGEIRIYLPSTQDGKMMYISPNVEQEAIRELNLKKYHLNLEMRNYEVGNLKRNANVGEHAALISEKKGVEVSAIPSKTELQTSFSINTGSDTKPPHVELGLMTNNDTIIRACLIFAEGIFQGECLVVHPKLTNLSSKIVVPLMPPKNVITDLHIKAYVGQKDSSNFHVFELTRQLTRFAMYALCKNGPKQEIQSYVQLPIQERPQRLSLWINQNFLMDKEVEEKGEFNFTFVCLRNHQEFQLHVKADGSTTIRTLDIDLAGDIVQDLCSFLNISDLETEAEFPEEIAQLDMLIRAVEEYQESNERRGADIADQSGVVKSLLIRAEDARIMDDIEGMRKWYYQLHELNRTLITQHQIRCTTNENVMESIKGINQIVQKAARLRGKNKAQVIMACRDSIKQRNIETLTKIIKYGGSIY